MVFSSSSWAFRRWVHKTYRHDKKHAFPSVESSSSIWPRSLPGLPLSSSVSSPEARLDDADTGRECQNRSFPKSASRPQLYFFSSDQYSAAERANLSRAQGRPRRGAVKDSDHRNTHALTAADLALHWALVWLIASPPAVSETVPSNCQVGFALDAWQHRRQFDHESWGVSMHV